MKHYLNSVTLPLIALIPVLFFALSAVNVLCEEEAADKTQPAAEKPMDKMQQEMMEKWKEYATPGEPHKAMEPLVGEWDYTVKWWNTPDAEPEESTGTSEAKWIMGGRFLKQKVEGTSMGQEFQGMGIMGYDNLKELYENVWIDNMGTGIMTSTGSYDPSTTTFTQTGTYSCPMEDGKEKSFRSVTTIVSADKYTYAMYGPGPDGKEYRMMEIEFTRKK